MQPRHNHTEYYDAQCAYCTGYPSIPNVSYYQQAGVQPGVHDHSVGHATTGFAGSSATFQETLPLEDYDDEAYDTFNGQYYGPNNYAQSRTYNQHHDFDQPHEYIQSPTYNQHDTYSQQEEDDAYGNSVGGSRELSAYGDTTSLQVRTTQQTPNSSRTGGRVKQRIEIQLHRAPVAGGAEVGGGSWVRTRISSGAQHIAPHNRQIYDVRIPRETQSHTLVSGLLKPPDRRQPSGSTSSGSMVSSRSAGSSGVSTAPSSTSYPENFCCGRQIINMRRHMVEVHGDPLPCYCPVPDCDRSDLGQGKGFKRKANMKTHLKSQHGESELIRYEYDEKNGDGAFDALPYEYQEQYGAGTFVRYDHHDRRRRR